MLEMTAQLFLIQRAVPAADPGALLLACFLPSLASQVCCGIASGSRRSRPSAHPAHAEPWSTAPPAPL